MTDGYLFGYQYQIQPSDYAHKSPPPWQSPWSSETFTHHPSIPLFLPPSSPAVTSVKSGEELAIIFVISALVFSIVGAYLGGAAVNSPYWLPINWNWNDPNTPVGIVSGAVGGILLPYGFFYSNATIGEVHTKRLALQGAYLGAAMVNRQWNPSPSFSSPGWDLTNPSTYYGAFEGMQTSLWFIDATSSITAFADENNLEGGPRGAFVGGTYGVGAAIAYHYVSQYHDGNYRFVEWDRVREPGTTFAILDGIETGTRLPVGFAEIGIELANRTTGSWIKGRPFFKGLNPWSFFGAGFMAFIYASEENKTFNVLDWDWWAFSTLEAILNGIVYGKDLPEMVEDVKKAFNLNNSGNKEDRGGRIAGVGSSQTQNWYNRSIRVFSSGGRDEAI